MARDLYLNQEDYKECLDYIKSRLCMNGLMTMHSEGSCTVYVPKSKQCEYFLDMFKNALEKTSSEISYNECAKEVFNDDRKGGEANMLNGLKKYMPTTSAKVLFSVIIAEAIKLYFDFI